MIEIPDLDDDDETPSPLAHLNFSTSASSSFPHARSGSFAGAGLPALPALRNPFATSDAGSSPVEVRSRSGSFNNNAGTPVASRRGHQTRSSSSGAVLPVNGSTSATQSPSAVMANGTPAKASPAPVTQADAASELALSHILESFIEVAEQKIGEAMAKSLDHEVFFPSLLAEGVDPAFDDLINSIGHIARRLPRIVIDMIMRWRKSQNEGVDSASVQRSVATATNPAAARTLFESMTERKSLASIHVLCRVLAVVISVVDKQTLGEELGAKLEDIIFNSLKNADPHQVQRSANRRANMELYARLIGSLSVVRFVGVSDRFIAELDQINRGFVTKETEPRVEHIIHGMRFLKLQVYPPEAFEESAEFIEALSGIFDAASGYRVKTALAVTLVPLITHVVRGANAEVHHPLWSRAMQTIHARAGAMGAKPRYSTAALPLICTTIAAGPEEMLMANWNNAMELCLNKMKDKAARPAALFGVVQVLWAYLRRCQESHAAVAKRLDPLFKTFFPPGRKSLFPPECSLELAACMPHYILFRHFELGTEMISNLLSSAQENIYLEHLAPERITVAIRAVMMTLDCFEKSQEPSLLSAPDGEEHHRFDLPAVEAGPLPVALLSRIGLTALLERVTSSIAIAANLCDRALASCSVLEDGHVTPVLYTPDRETYISRRNGLFAVTYARDRQSYFDMQRACFDAWPRCLRSETADFKPVDILLRALLHVDPEVAASAKAALERLAKLGGGPEVVLSALRFVVQPELAHRDTASHQAATNAKIEELVAITIGLAKIWLGQLQALSKQTAIEAPSQRRFGASEATKDAALADVDPTQSWPLVAELEAAALVLFCADDATHRRRALELIHLAVDYKDQLQQWTALKGLPSPASSEVRLLQLLEQSSSLLDSIDEDRVPAQERSRLQRWRKMPDALLRIAESEVHFDFGLWQMLLGGFFTICSEQATPTAAVARPLLAARTLRLYQTAGSVAGLITPRNPPTTPMRERPNMIPPSPSETPALADAWRTHLTALCALTTASSGSASESDITGVDLIRIVIPFLASEQVGLRDAVVSGLGSMNAGLFRPLLDSMQAITRHLGEERKARRSQSQGVARRSKRFDRLHVSVARILELNGRLLRKVVDESHDAILGPLLFYVRENLLFFRDPEMHEDMVAINMRRSYCNIVREVVEYCAAHQVAEHWLPADLQAELFSLFDSWSFRQFSSMSPDATRGPRSVGSHGHHTNQSRGSSLGSAPSSFEVYLPATAAIAALCECKGLVIKKDASERAVGQVDAQELLRWTQALFEQINPAGHLHARRALLGVLASHPSHKLLLDAIAYQCFAEPESLSLEASTWAVVAEAALNQPDFGLKQSTLFCLALWKMGHPDLQTRQRAVDVLAPHLLAELRATLLKRCQTALYSSFPGAALQARRELSSALATCHADDARSVFLELTIRILQIGSKQTRLLLQLLPPWIAGLRLPVPDKVTKTTTDPVLANLFLLSAKYGDMYYGETRELWDAIAAGAEGANFRILLRFLVDETVRRGSKDFARHAQRVVGCLCECDRAATLLQELSELVQPAEMAGSGDIEATPLASSTGNAPRRTNLDTLFPVHNRKITTSSAGAALLLAGDALVAGLGTTDAGIPRLLHGFVIAVDHSTVFVRTHARDCLMRCLTLLGKLPDSNGVRPRANDSAEGDFAWRGLWEHDDHGIMSPADQHTPRNMSALIDDAVRLLEPSIPDIRRLWGMVAMEWATSCPLRHVACRSFQAFRLLMPAVTQRMLAEMVARLVSTVADELADNRLFAREVSWTLSAVVAKSEVSTLVELPQLLWASAVCLDTTVEDEFAEAMRTLEGFLKKLGGHLDPAELESCRPPSLAVTDASLIRLVAHKGLRSSTTCDLAFRLLQQLASSPLAGLVATPEQSLALLYVTAMLYGLQALELGKVDAGVEAFALQVAAIGEGQGKSNISRIMVSLAKNRFRTKDDFVRQATANLTEYFSVSERIDVVLLLLSVLLNPLSWMRLRSLTLLKAFAKQNCLTDSDAEQLPPDALRPLLELLAGEYAKPALEVMDEALPGAKRLLAGPARPATSVSVRRGRNMSLGDNVDRAVFGETQASGWSVPTSKAARQGVRHRLREVVDTCAGLSSRASSRSGSPIAFAADEYDTSSGAIDANGVELDTADNSTLGDMVDALHDLGSFFEDGASNASSTSLPAMNGLATNALMPDRSGAEAASAAPSFRMSQALGSASRVAAVLARSLRSSSHSHHQTTSSSATPRMATIAETSQTPFNAAFADSHGSQPTPRLESTPLQRYNSEGLYSTASSSAAGSSSPRHRRDGTRESLSSDSEGDSAWGDEDPASASSHENLRRTVPAGLSFTPVWDASSTLSDGDEDSENVFGFDSPASPRRRRTPFYSRKRATPSPRRAQFTSITNTEGGVQ